MATITTLNGIKIRDIINRNESGQIIGYKDLGEAGVTGRNLFTFVYYIKNAFYTNKKLGVAAAASILLFGIIFVFTMLQRYIQKKANN